jgi:hypothetical protein
MAESGDSDSQKLAKTAQRAKNVYLRFKPLLVMLFSLG